MRLRIILLLGWTACFAAAQDSACHPVDGDRIRAKDLAAVLPEFRTAPADALLGQSPLPGAQRTFHAQELYALAHRFGIVLAAAPDTCFEWATQPLDRDAAIAAMLQALQVPNAKIEIADMITAHVPAGRVEFPLSSLGTPSPTGPSAPVLWHGSVVYGDNHHFPVWARVGVTAPCQKVVAAESLKAGQPIESRQVRVTTAACFPVGMKELPIEAVAGMLPLHFVSTGAELRAELLVPPNEVNRGEAVQIEVRSGAARVAFTGRALTGGRNGETISVLNPESKKPFQARITGKGTAIVEAGNTRGI